MRRFELEFHADGCLRLERILTELGLGFKRLSLKTLPAAVHWHITKPGEKGTLEATWDLDAEAFWLCTRANRYATWQDEVITALTRNLL